jgi:zinc and cadmium transporter
MSLIYIYTFVSVTVISAISLIGVFALSWRQDILKRFLIILVSLAAGALLGDAFIHLIPDALISSYNPHFTGLLIIVGILIFFLLEHFLHWHHYHNSAEDEAKFHSKQNQNKDACEHRPGVHPTGYMVLISDGVHNMLDGIIIGASYLAGIEIGIATTIAVILHEIPQEIGDFGVLLHSGFSGLKALLLNFLSALLAFLGAIFALTLGGASSALTEWVVPITAGGFIYIATADLIPELHKTRSLRKSILQFMALLLGVSAMYFLVFVE